MDLNIRLHPSFTLLLLFFAIFLGGLYCLFVSSCLFWLKLLICLPTIVYAYLFYQRFYCLAASASVTEIIYLKNAVWNLRLGDDSTVRVRLKSPAVLTRYCLILHFCSVGKIKHFPVFLLFDSASKDKLCKLRKIIALISEG